MTLNSDDRKRLKQLSHHLKPVVRIGQHGLGPGVIAETDAQLAHHELIKIHIAQGEREQRRAMAESLARACDAVLIHAVGKNFVLFRPRQTP